MLYCCQAVKGFIPSRFPCEILLSTLAENVLRAAPEQMFREAGGDTSVMGASGQMLTLQR